MPYITNTQIQNPLPAGHSVYYRPDWSCPPILDVESSHDYWVRIMGLDILPPPPPGMVHVIKAIGDNDHYQLLTLPELPEGEQWMVLTDPYTYYSLTTALVLPDWYSRAPYVRGREFGPPVFDCRMHGGGCLHRDGCSGCNPSEYVRCFGGGCSGDDIFRVPARLEQDGAGLCVCATLCDMCAATHNPYSLNWVEGPNYSRVCGSCRRASYSQCGHCENWYLDEVISDHEPECDHRPDPEPFSGSNSPYIHDYSYTPNPLVFHGEGKYHLGVELELNTYYCDGNSVAEKISDSFGSLVYLKEDSSISEGFEVVTHPMTFDFARSVDWGIIERVARDDNVAATSDCGMHVHVSRTAFDTASHVYRWMRFIYRNADSVQQLARRRGSSYAAFNNSMNAWSIHWAAISKMSRAQQHTVFRDSDPWYMNTPAGKRRVMNVGAPYGTERYSAINVENEDTFELRFFASTVCAEELIGALGFVESSIEYTRQLNAHKVVTQKGLQFETFCSWVKDNNDDGRYGALLNQIERLVH